MRLVCLSDTHMKHWGVPRMPEGDVLIHAGDSLGCGNLAELEIFVDWFSKYDHPHKILIAGNHDWVFERQPKVARKVVEEAGVIYLNDDGVTIDGVKFWGSPVQPEFCDWAFNRKRGEEIDRHWQLIPDDTDVLITHGPPHGLLDKTEMTEVSVGCEDLRRHVLQRVKPMVHIFGHIHSAAGIRRKNGIKFINASQLDDYYSNPDGYRPLVFEVEK